LSKIKSLSHVAFVSILNNNYIDKGVKSGYNQYFKPDVFGDIDLTQDYQIKIKLKRANITTENNFLYNIFSNDDTETYIYKYEFQSIPKILQDPLIFTLVLKVELDNYIDVIERRYIKLVELLANIGSIVLIVDIFTKFFADFFSEGNLEQAIYKEIFYFKKKKQDSSVDGNILIRNFTQKFNILGFLLINKNNNKHPSIISKTQALYNMKDSTQKDIELKIFSNHKQDLIKNENVKEDFQNNFNEGKNNNEINSTFFDKTSRFLNDEKNLKNDQIKPSDEFKEINNLKNENEINRIEDEKLYENFKKILKEKTIKKSFGANLYKICRPMGIKKNKNIENLMKLQEYI